MRHWSGKFQIEVWASRSNCQTPGGNYYCLQQSTSSTTQRITMVGFVLLCIIVMFSSQVYVAGMTHSPSGMQYINPVLPVSDTNIPPSLSSSSSALFVFVFLFFPVFCFSLSMSLFFVCVFVFVCVCSLNVRLRLN